VLFVLALCLSVYSQNPICTVATINTDISIHIRTANPDSAVFVGCSNRAPVECKYYSVYRVFQCRAQDNPCIGPRYATIDGQCCDLGEGCPQLPPTTSQPTTGQIPPPPTTTSQPTTTGAEPQPTIIDRLAAAVSSLGPRVAELETREATTENLFRQTHTTDHEARLTTLENSFRQSFVTDHEARLASLESISQQQGRTIAKLEQQNALLKNVVDNSAQQITTLLSQINALRPENPPTNPAGNPPTKPTGDPTGNPTGIPPPNTPSSTPSERTNPTGNPTTINDPPVEILSQESESQATAKLQQQQQAAITSLSVMVVLGLLGIICIVAAVVLYRRRKARAMSMRE